MIWLVLGVLISLASPFVGMYADATGATDPRVFFLVGFLGGFIGATLIGIGAMNMMMRLVRRLNV